MLFTSQSKGYIGSPQKPFLELSAIIYGNAKELSVNEPLLHRDLAASL